LAPLDGVLPLFAMGAGGMTKLRLRSNRQSIAIGRSPNG